MWVVHIWDVKQPASRSGRRPSTEGRAHNRQSAPQATDKVKSHLFHSKILDYRRDESTAQSGQMAQESESLVQNKELAQASY